MWNKANAYRHCDNQVLACRNRDEGRRMPRRIGQDKDTRVALVNCLSRETWGFAASAQDLATAVTTVMAWPIPNSRAAATVIWAFLTVACVFVCRPETVSAQGRNGGADADSAHQTARGSAALPLVHGVTPHGVPAPKVQVRLVGGDYGAPVTLAATISDEQGRFGFVNLPDRDAVVANLGSMDVWAWSGNRQIGWFHGLREYQRKPVTVCLKEAKTFDGRLVDGSGRPIEGAAVRPEILTSKQLGTSDANFGQLSPEMRRARQATTDADGRFQVPAIPSNGTLITTVTAAGFGQPRVSWNLDEPLTIRLPATGTVNGGIDLPTGATMPKTPPGQRLGQVWLRGAQYYNGDGNPIGVQLRPAYRVSVRQPTAIDRDGRFHVSRVPPGTYALVVKFEPHLPLRMVSGHPQSIVVRSGKVTDNVPLKVSVAYSIRGRVLGALDKEPVAEAGVQLYHIVDGSMRHVQRVTTDADGNYLAHVPQGKIQIRVPAAPAKYIPLNLYLRRSQKADNRQPTIDVQQATTWPDLLLDPAGDVEIEVVDEQGDPVADAMVKVLTPVEYESYGDFAPVEPADGVGRYTIRRVALNDTLPIRVRSDMGVSDPELTVTPGELNGPVRVQLSAANGFRFRGKVVDTQGKPISDATIGLVTYLPYATKWQDAGGGVSFSGGAGTYKKNARGFFQTGPLWPDTTYQVSASAAGYGTATAPQKIGKRGEIVAIRPFVLSKSPAAVAGVVVDPDGTPLRGVRVFVRSSNWQLATAYTDAAGKFGLEELAADSQFVFADLAGYRFGGTRLSDDSASLRIVLRTNNSPPQGVDPPVLPQRAKQLQLAQELVEQAWRLPTHPRSTARMGQLAAMVSIDPALAQVMSELAGGTFDYVVRLKLAEQTRDEDPEGALRLLRKSGPRGLDTTIRWARELARSPDRQDHETARRFAKLAEQRARRVAPPRNFSRVAALWTMIGEHDRARALLDGALEFLEQNEIDRTMQRLPKQTAIALVPYDFERAHKMVAEMDEGSQRSATGASMAVSLARTDLDRGLRLIDGLKGDGNARRFRDRARLLIALDLAGKDTERAVGIVQQCDVAAHRGQALGRLAVRMAEFDRPKAWKLIDEALVIHRSPKDAYRSWSSFGGGGPFAAVLAYQAQQVGYPDMRSVVWHVLAACQAKGRAHGQARLRATIGTARILGLVDQEATRQLLESVVDQEEQMPRGDGGLSMYDQWMQAWLLVDFQHGTKMLRADLQRLADSGKQDPLRRGHHGVFPLLSAAPHERFDIIVESATALWDLDEE